MFDWWVILNQGFIGPFVHATYLLPEMKQTLQAIQGMDSLQDNSKIRVLKEVILPQQERNYDELRRV